jgi:cytoskeletal protein CcmA (bactofilin family)
MWRKQEQPKASSPAAEVAVGSVVGTPEKPNTPNAHSAVTTSVPPSSSPSKPALDAPAVGSRLTSSLTIKGEITGREDLLIDANLDGLVHLDGATVTVGPNGRLTANIEAGEIVVHGDVTGGLLAAERVRVGPTGRTTGEIVARRIFIEAGAEIHGSVEVMRTDKTPAARAGAPTSAQVAVPRAAVQSAQPPAEEPSAAA